MALFVPEQKQQAALAPVLKQPIELFIACRDLIKKDANSKSDPFVVVYMKDSKNKQWHEIGRTEVIYDNHFPKFSKQCFVAIHHAPHHLHLTLYLLSLCQSEWSTFSRKSRYYDSMSTTRTRKEVTN